jgi:protocatechuate 3,4-dioxygenase alpha subunit
MIQTPSQTIGPYFAYALTPKQYGYDFPGICGPDLTTGNPMGEVITLTGRVFDGEGKPVNDAMIEIWQADTNGHYGKVSEEGFTGFGRCGTGTDPDNKFEFRTIKPGRNGASAPCINVIVFMRGLLSHIYTRVYFEDEERANSTDELLNSVPEDRRATLIAKRTDSNKGPLYTFNIHMQGDEETVFFDV